MADPVETFSEKIERTFGGGNDYRAAIMVLRVSRVVSMHIQERLDQDKLTRQAWTVLTMIYSEEEGALTLGSMAKRMRVHPTTITNAVDQLENAKFVTRRQHPNDRRTTYAILTALGARRCEAILNDLIQGRFGLEGWNESDVKAAIDLLGKIEPLES